MENGLVTCPSCGQRKPAHSMNGSICLVCGLAARGRSLNHDYSHRKRRVRLTALWANGHMQTRVRLARKGA